MAITIGTHFCKGEAVESKILFGETHLGCDMMNLDQPSDDSECASDNIIYFDKTPCCENEFQTIQAINEFVVDATYTTINVELAIAIIYTALNFDLFPKSSQQFNSEYIPNPTEKDIQALFQTYLI